MEIEFDTQQEAADFYRRLPSSFRQLNGVLQINNRLAVFPEKTADFKEFAQLITRYIIDLYEKKWIMEIIEKFYYFTDPEEQVAILNIVSAIFAGEKNDLPQIEVLKDRRETIMESLEGMLHEHHSFSFASIIRFRLTAYKEALRRFVEVAIDEYKLEQEYQVFVDKLRRIIRAYKPLCEKIEVYDEHPFRLYDDRHRLIRNMQSVRSFYPLLKQWGIEAEPSIVLSLIALAPKQVIVYTNRPDSGVMKTLHHVFEDRVCFVHSSLRMTSENRIMQ
ncbi:putative sporulation protein YtxC [Sporolactobacillus sp. CPB3-1]|uniref:Sporulation protein YtxC n=1 Tax=Sporolactobacillus mangiferae TaxID=2940498 RepID=A0ABT0M8C1_9BACL|nr:putative sporulation protein YtxC [Sporolactobacillus mangiferae]MCL1630595.1 putative sporulation protein YtxC [Sporolactobacillus mangiferae]